MGTEEEGGRGERRGGEGTEGTLSASYHDLKSATASDVLWVMNVERMSSR